MPNAGYATLQIIPSLRGVSEEMRRQLVGPAADAGDTAGQQASGGFKGSFKAGMLAAGAAAGAVLVAATVSAVQKEKASDRLAAQLGASGKGAKKAGQVAGALYSGAVVDSFEDGAAAVRAVMGSGLVKPGETNKAIQSITTKVADLAGTFDQDLTGTANAAAQMIRTGLAKNGSQALDLLTKGFQSNANKADDLVDTMNEYGTQFRKAGLTGADAIGLLNQAIGAGARDADVAADAIKEFSIRAVDGSDTTAQGFKMLGLNADAMGAKFAKGGKAANGVLDLTLDKLRGIKDPVKQSQAAVALFGTQAEDLGAALFAMDPSKAAAGLGKVGGAAKKVGDTIRGNTATEIEILKRSFMGFLGGVVTSVVLPGLMGLVRAIRWVGGALAATGQWVRQYGAWLLPLVVIVGGLTLALNAQAIATAFVTAVFSAYRAAIVIGTAVTNGFAGAQALLNSIMALNPITLIVIALVALGAALVVAWNKSATFRNIVMATWSGIKAAALTAWNAAIKPALKGIWTAMQAVGRVAMWLWRNAIGPAFRFIWTAAKVLFAIVATAVLFPLIVVFKLVAKVAKWLWSNAIGPAFRAIGGIFKWLWSNVVKPIFALVRAAFRLLGSVAKWLYDNVMKPVFNKIKLVIAVWWAATKIVFAAVVRFLRGTLGVAFRWLRDNVIRPVWAGIKATISTVWSRGIRPAFEALKRGVSAVGRAFQAAVRFIGRVWDGLKSVAKKPVQFVVDTVYNNGIRKVWNMVAGLVGLKKLSPVKFAEGGRTRGGVPGKDSIPALMMADEYVIKRDSARKVGFGALEYINQTGELPGFASGGRVMPVQRFAEGGLVDWLSGAAKKIGGAVLTGLDFLSSPGKAWDTATQFVRDKLSGLKGSEWARAIAQFPIKMLKGLKDHIVKAASGVFGGGSAKGSVRTALAFAKSQAGKPYQWGGVGNPSWDCSGFMGGIQSVIMGQNPRRRLWSTFSFQGSRAPSGWRLGLRSPFTVGITNAGVGHTAGTLAGVNVESRGGDGVVVGRRARGANSGLFTHRYGFAPALKFDQGGHVPPGLHTVYNGTRRPEPVLTGRQWDAITAAARGGDGGTSYVINARTADFTVRDLELLQRRQDARARVGRPR